MGNKFKMLSDFIFSQSAKTYEAKAVKSIFAML